MNSSLTEMTLLIIKSSHFVECYYPLYLFMAASKTKMHRGTRTTIWLVSVWFWYSVMLALHFVIIEAVGRGAAWESDDQANQFYTSIHAYTWAGGGIGWCGFSFVIISVCQLVGDRHWGSHFVIMESLSLGLILLGIMLAISVEDPTPHWRRYELAQRAVDHKEIAISCSVTPEMTFSKSNQSGFIQFLDEGWYVSETDDYRSKTSWGWTYAAAKVLNRNPNCFFNPPIYVGCSQKTTSKPVDFIKCGWDGNLAYIRLLEISEYIESYMKSHVRNGLLKSNVFIVGEYSKSESEDFLELTDIQRDELWLHMCCTWLFLSVPVVGFLTVYFWHWERKYRHWESDTGKDRDGYCCCPMTDGNMG